MRSRNPVRLILRLPGRACSARKRTSLSYASNARANHPLPPIHSWSMGNTADHSASENPSAPRRVCKKCGSAVLFRSHTRSTYENLLYVLGASVQRCHTCQARWAYFSRRSLPLKRVHNTARETKAAFAIVVATLVCLLVALFMFGRYHR
jgi:hypothetical protein